MKIHTAQSSRFHADQISRIEAGFRALGHEVTPHVSEADLIYQNNPWFDQVLADKAAGRFAPGAKLILDVQDIPHHVRDYPIARLKEQLLQADAVTSISATTARDLKAATGLDSHVISQPIMPITRTGVRKHGYRALFVGRVWDGNKRSTLAARALAMLGFRAQDVVTVGMEAPPFGGDYWGVATEAALNDLYNSVDFVVATARFAGMELAVIEAMAAGVVPLCFNDLHTLDELLPPDLFPEYRAIDPDPEALAHFMAYLLNDESGQRMAELKERLHQHYLTAWNDRTSPTGVARAILQVYETLT